MKIPAKLRSLIVFTFIAGLTAPVIDAAPPAKRSPDASNAAHLYMKSCEQCHGRLGHGDGPRAAHLKTRIHSFADCGWMAMRSGATLFLAIKEGSGAVGLLPEMPAFDGKLDDQQIVELVNYVRGFCLDKAAAGTGSRR